MSIRWRLILSLAIGVISAAGSYSALAWRGQYAADFTWPWRAAQQLLAGLNPYTIFQPGGEYPFQVPFYYPLPAVLAALPFSWLPPYLAGALFFGVSAGLLAYTSSRDGWKRMPIFLSAPFFVAGAVAQWSPLLVASALTPALQWLAACKPNIGLAAYMFRPTRSGLALMISFLLLSFLVLPSWLGDWLHVTRGIPGHRPPILTFPLGSILLLSALRWRRAEGRLLLAISLVPQHIFFYDQLPLWLIPNGFISSLLYSGLSWVAYFAWRLMGTDLQTGVIIAPPTTHILLLVYVPALVMVLWSKEAVMLRRFWKRVKFLIDRIW